MSEIPPAILFLIGALGGVLSYWLSVLLMDVVSNIKLSRRLRRLPPRGDWWRAKR